jgi:hypothetical protein
LVAGPPVLDDVDPSTPGSAVRSLSVATLALVLVSDATRLAGVDIGAPVAAVIVHAGRLNLISDAWLQTITVAGAFLASLVAAGLDGSGFNPRLRHRGGIRTSDAAQRPTADGPYRGSRAAAGRCTFLMFGAVLLGGVPQDLDSYAVFHGILSLSAVRMIPVALGLSRTRARPATVAFVRWFGPVVSLRGCSW